MQTVRRSGLMCALMATLVLPSLALRPATLEAREGETAHLKLGIVGVDEYSHSGVGRGVRVVDLLGPRSLRGDLRRGDVMLWVDGNRVRDSEALAEALAGRNGSRSVGVLRRGELREVMLPRASRRADLAIRDVLRDVRREVRRDVRRDVIRDVRDARREAALDLRRDVRDLVREVRRDVVRDVHRLRRDVVVRRADRAEIRDAMRRLGERLRELERLEAEEWH